MCRGWAFLEALYRAGSGWRVGFDGADWWKRSSGLVANGRRARGRGKDVMKKYKIVIFMNALNLRVPKGRDLLID
jgi:hypothetical protein